MNYAPRPTYGAASSCAPSEKKPIGPDNDPLFYALVGWAQAKQLQSESARPDYEHDTIETIFDKEDEFKRVMAEKAEEARAKGIYIPFEQ